MDPATCGTTAPHGMRGYTINKETRWNAKNTR